jgi:hypothetical protein
MGAALISLSIFSMLLISAFANSGFASVAAAEWSCLAGASDGWAWAHQLKQRAQNANRLSTRKGLGVFSMSSVDLFGFCELQFDCEWAKKFQAVRGPQKGR